MDKLGATQASSERRTPATRAPVMSFQQQMTSTDHKSDATQTPAENIRYIQVPDASSTGWPAMFKTVRDADVAKVDDCKDDIDTLLVFAGLYSAVLSAFLVETYQNLQEDKQDIIVGLLRTMATQNYVSNGAFLNSTNTLPSPTPFVPAQWAIRVNVLWFTSLILSLSVASLGMLVKQWLREYLALEYTSPQQRLRARQYRQPALSKWKVFEIAAALPIVLQISLGLFFLGLCFFTSAIHESVRNSTIPVACAWAFFFLITTIAPLFSPRCPYKTTFLKSTMKIGRQYVGLPTRSAAYFVLLRAFALSAATGKRLRVLAQSLARSIDVSRRGPNEASDPQTGDRGTQPKEGRTVTSLDELMEEDKVVTAIEQEDSDILLAVDAVFSDDALLPTMLDVLLHQQTMNPAITMGFVLEIISRRTGTKRTNEPLAFLPNLQVLSKQAWLALSSAVAVLLAHNVPAPLNKDSPTWALNGAIVLLGRPKEDLPDVGIRAMEKHITSRSDVLLVTMLDILQRHHIPSGATGMRFIVQFILIHTGIDLTFENGTPTFIQGLHGLSQQAWVMLVSGVASLCERHASAPLHDHSPRWTVDSIFILLLHSGYSLPEACVRVLERYITPTALELMEKHYSLGPAHITQLLLHSTSVCAGIELPLHNLTYLLDLHGLSTQLWVTLTTTISRLLRHHVLRRLDENSPGWVLDAVIVLLSQSQYGLPHSAADMLRTYVFCHRDSAAVIGARLALSNLPHTPLRDQFLRLYSHGASPYKLSAMMGMYKPLLCRHRSCNHRYLYELLDAHIQVHDNSAIMIPSTEAYCTTARNLEVGIGRQDVLDDLFTTLTYTLTLHISRLNNLEYESEGEAVEVLLQFGKYVGHTPGALKVTQACLTHPHHPYLRLFLATHPSLRLSSACEHLFVDAVAGLDTDERRTFLKIIMQNLEEHHFGYFSCDLLRFLLLLLRACQQATTLLALSSTLPSLTTAQDFSHKSSHIFQVIARRAKTDHDNIMSLMDWEYELEAVVPPWRAIAQRTNKLTIRAAMETTSSLAANCLDILEERQDTQDWKQHSISWVWEIGLIIDLRAYKFRGRWPGLLGKLTRSQEERKQDQEIHAQGMATSETKANATNARIEESRAAIVTTDELKQSGGEGDEAMAEAADHHTEIMQEGGEMAGSEGSGKSRPRPAKPLHVRFA